MDERKTLFAIVHTVSISNLRKIGSLWNLNKENVSEKLISEQLVPPIIVHLTQVTHAEHHFLQFRYRFAFSWAGVQHHLI